MASALNLCVLKAQYAPGLFVSQQNPFAHTGLDQVSIIHNKMGYDLKVQGTTVKWG